MQERHKIDLNLLTIIISIGIIIILLLFAPVLELINKKLYGNYLELRNTYFTDTFLPEIVVVEIDDESLSELWSFPFPRSLYAQSIANLQSYSPATIALDILFLDSSNEAEDSALQNTFDLYDNIVLGSSINGEWELGINVFNERSGFLPVRVSALNNTVYSFVPKYTDISNQSQEHFTLAVLRSYYSYFFGTEAFEWIGDFEDIFYNFSPEHSFLLSEKGADDILINYDNEIRIKTIPFSKTLDNDSLATYISGNSLKDAIILIGPAAEGFWDSFYTPYDRLYGLHIHAHIISTLLSKTHLSYADIFVEWCTIFLVIILAVLINLSSKRYVVIVWNLLMTVIFVICIPLFLLWFWNIILRNPSEIAIALILAFASANIVKYIIEKWHKKRLGKALSEYVWSSIADEILLEHGKVNLDGETRELVCFFSDIEGFTTLSERLWAESVVAFLREYLSEMTHIIVGKKWHIDKFEGDAVMALWWAFSLYSEEDCKNACEAALEQQKVLKDISKNNTEILYGTELKIRIWIHEGNAIIGNIWAKGEKMEFTALWDTVNLASRLEWVNKYYGTYICVSQQVYDATKDDFAYRFLDEIRVQWKKNSVKIYELLGYKKDISEIELWKYMKFSRAMTVYRKWNFLGAHDIFHQLWEDGDTPSKIFAQRCYNFQKKPPQDWDGIWDMEGK